MDRDSTAFHFLCDQFLLVSGEIPLDKFVLFDEVSSLYWLFPNSELMLKFLVVSLFRTSFFLLCLGERGACNQVGRMELFPYLIAQISLLLWDDFVCLLTKRMFSAKTTVTRRRIILHFFCSSFVNAFFSRAFTSTVSAVFLYGINKFLGRGIATFVIRDVMSIHIGAVNSLHRPK